MKSTISTIFDFVIDTLTDSPYAHAPPKSIMELKEIMKADCAEPGAFCCVLLWNDEVHSFQEVISQVMDATGCSQNEARVAAETVDSYVFFCLLLNFKGALCYFRVY